MKYFRFLTIAAVAAMLGSCQTEPTENGPVSMAGKEVNITCSIEGSRVATEIDMRKSYFENGDMIALDIMRRPLYQTEPMVPTYAARNTSDYYLHNALMVYNDGEWTFLKEDTKIILEEGYRYDYYAFYPGVAVTDRDPQAMEYSLQTNTGSYIQQKDLLWASFATTNPGDYNKTEIPLNFKHVVSMLEVRQVGLGDIAQVKLKSDQKIILNGTFDMGTGEFTTAPAEGIETHIPDNNAVNGYRIIAQKTAKEVTFLNMSNGRYALYLPPQSLKSNFKTVIETTPDKDIPTVKYSYQLQPNDGGDRWEIKAGESMFRSYDSKLMEPDPTTGLMQYENMMYTPNCIMLNSSAVSRTVPVVKAYAMWLYDQNLNGGTPPFEELYGALELKLLWTDAPDFTEKVTVRLDDPRKGVRSRITARINDVAVYEGNALYGLYINGKLRWSWHVWANSVQNPISNPGINGDTRFMRSNLGAWSATTKRGGMRGLLYQWGRKDPFPAADNSGWDFSIYQPVYNEKGEQINSNLPVGTAIGALNTIAGGVQNPTVFSTTWNPTATGVLWDVPFTGGAENTDKKSPYDPCPLGWRVPRTETESAWYLANAGEDLNNYTESPAWINGVMLRLGEYRPGTYQQTNFRIGSTGAISTAESTVELWHGGVKGNSLWIADKTAPNIKVDMQDTDLAKGKAVRCMKDVSDLQIW